MRKETEMSFFKKLCFIVDNYGAKDFEEYDGKRPHTITYSYHNHNILIIKERNLDKNTYIIFRTYFRDNSKNVEYYFSKNDDIKPPKYIIDFVDGIIVTENKKEEEQKEKALKAQEEHERIEDANIRSKHIIEATNSIRDYEDNYIKVITNYIDYYDYEIGNYVKYVSDVTVILNESNTTVFKKVMHDRLAVDDTYDVLIYRPGKWENIIMTIYNRKKENLLKEKDNSENIKIKQLEYERTRYLPIDE